MWLCALTLFVFYKYFCVTENEPIPNPARWVILDDNRFSKELETYLRGTGEAKNTVFACLSKSHVDHSIQNKYFEFQIFNLILKNKIETYLVCLYSLVSILSNLESIFRTKVLLWNLKLEKTIATRHALQKEWNYFLFDEVWGRTSSDVRSQIQHILIYETDFHLIWPLKWSSQRQMAQNMFHFLEKKSKSFKHVRAC